MALPHLPTTYTTSKNIYEKSIVDRRNRENEFRQKWLQNATFFQQANLTAAKIKTWESDISFNDRCDLTRFICKQVKNLDIKIKEATGLLSFKCYVMQWGVSNCQENPRYVGVCFDVISASRGWVGP